MATSGDIKHHGSAHFSFQNSRVRRPATIQIIIQFSKHAELKEN
jgi:hypothetical protein